MNLNLLQKKSVIHKIFMNFPRKLEPLSLAEQAEQIFCTKYHHILERFYRFSVAEKNVGDFMCLVALLDFEKHPTKVKRDFLMRHFINDKGSSYFINISGKNRRAIRQSVKIEDLAGAQATARGLCISSAMFRTENMPLLRPQMPNTFTSTLFKTALRQNISAFFSQFRNMDDMNIIKTINCPDSELSTHQNIIVNMMDTGFKVPRFMQNTRSI